MQNRSRGTFQNIIALRICRDRREVLIEDNSFTGKVLISAVSATPRPCLTTLFYHLFMYSFV